MLVDGSLQAPGNKYQVSTLEVALSRFSHNSAGRQNLPNSMPSGGGSWGGAIYLGDVPKLGVSPDQFPTQGNLICRLSSMTVFSENSAAYGGAVAGVRISELSMDSVTFFENSGWHGGALYVKSHGWHFPSQGVTPNHYVGGWNLTFVSNAATYGGAIHLVAAGQTASLENSGISPKSISYRGFDSSFVELRYPDLPQSVELYESWGVAPFQLSSYGLNSSLTGGNNNEDDLFFENCSFSGNIALRSGGAFFVQTARSGCRNCLFNQNHADESSDGAGGGVALVDEAAFHGRNVSFFNNVAGNGGAISAEKSLVDLVVAHIDDNVASGYGGGLHIDIPSPMQFESGIVSRISRSSIQRNTARIGGKTCSSW